MLLLTESTHRSQTGQEMIATTQPFPFGLHCDGWEYGQVGGGAHTGRRAYCVCACVCVCVCVRVCEWGKEKHEIRNRFKTVLNAGH